MTRDTQRLFEEALALSEGDRAQLAADLLASLDPADNDVASAWAAEISQRAAEARANPADDEDWRTALDDVQRELPRR